MEMACALCSPCFFKKNPFMWPPRIQTKFVYMVALFFLFCEQLELRLINLHGIFLGVDATIWGNIKAMKVFCTSNEYMF
jgi:hypothetical protein